MKKGFAFILALIFTMGALPAFAQPVEEEQPAERPGMVERNDRVGIRLNYWSASYFGDIEFRQEDQVMGQDVAVGEDLDIVDDFGLDNPQDVYEFEGWIRFGKKHRVLISYYYVDYGGEETQDTDVEFAGYTFEANTELETKWAISRLKVMHEWSPVYNDKGRLGLLWGMEYFVWELGYKGTADAGGGSTEYIDESELMPLPIPLVGIGGELFLPYGFGLYGNLNGIGAGFDGGRAGFLDYELGLNFDYKWFHAGVAYRALDFTLEYEEDGDENMEIDWHTTQSGTLFSVGATF